MSSTRSIEVLATAADLFHAAAEEFIRAARTAIGAPSPKNVRAQIARWKKLLANS